MERFAFDCEVKFASDSEAEGMVEGYGSVFNLLDRGGDIVLPGAFKRSIAKLKKMPLPMLWQHDCGAPVGVWNDLVEDEKGLRVKGPLVMEVPLAVSARALIKAGALRGLSIGYETVDYEIDRKTGARLIKEAILWEISLVTFPMLLEAQISGVKNFDVRSLERVLRDELKMSQSDAVSAVALFKKHLREGDDPSSKATRDGLSDLVMTLRKAIEALR